MIRYILVDDNTKVLDTVKLKIDTISEDFELIHVNSFDSSKKAYECINPNDFDLLIVDFEMPVYNGIELAKKIAFNKKIIFLTSTVNNEQKVINSLNVSGFLSKPFDLEEFQDILKNKILSNASLKSKLDNPTKIKLQIGVHKDVQFAPEQVYYASTFRNRNGSQPNKNCLHIYGENDELLFSNVRISVNDLYKAIGSYNFERISKNTIVNVSHLKERDNTNISLFNCSETFELTTKEKPSFLAKLRSKIGF